MTDRKKPSTKKASSKPQAKAQRSPRQFIHSSMRTLEGAGTLGAKYRPRTQDDMIRRLGGWMYACANLNAKKFAAQTLCLYAKTGGGKKTLRQTRSVDKRTKRYLCGDAKHQPGRLIRTKANSLSSNEDIEEVLDHPILDLLETVNGYMNGYDFAWQRSMFKQQTGNVYLHPVLNNLGVPGQLWLMFSQWTEIIPDKSARELISGYAYGVQQPRQHKFTPDEVLHDRIPAQDDVFYGKGPAYYAASQLSLLESMDEYELALFDNHARPDWGVFVKENMTETQFTRLQGHMDSVLKGKKKSGRPYIFEGGMDAKPLQWAPKDLAHAEGQRRTVEELASIYGTPITKLIQTDATFSNGAEGDYSWLADTIHPMCVSDAQFLNQKLLPMFEGSEDYFLAYKDCVPEDQQRAADITTKYVSGGIMRTNEARSELGLEDDPAGEVLRFNGTPLDMMGMSMGMGMGAPGLPSGSLPGDAGDGPTDPDADSAPNTAAPTLPIDPNLPAPIEAPPTEPGQIETTEALVLNGAQIQAAKDIILSVVAGAMPRDSALGQLEVFFNLTTEQANRIMGSAGMSNVPTTPNPNPAKDAELQAEADNAAATLEANGGSAGDDNEDDDDPPGSGGSGNPTGGKPPKPPAGGPAKSAGLPDEAHNGVGGLIGKGHDHACVDHGHGDSSQVAELHKAWDTSEGINTKAIDDPQEGIKDAVLIAFASSMTDTLRKQFDDLITELTRQGRGPNEAVNEALRVLVEPKYAEAIAASARPFMVSAIDAGGQFGIRRLRGITASLPPALGFDVSNPEVQKFIDRYTVKLSNGVQGYTYARAKNILGDGLSKGESISQLTERVQEWAGKVGDGVRGLEYRAANIARTESARAYVAGQEEAWKQTGVVRGKRWLLGPSPCSFCSAMAAQFNGKTVNLGTAFLPQGATITDGEGATMTLDYSETMGPPLHPQCVCDVIPMLDGE